MQKIIPHPMHFFVQLLSRSNIFSWDFDLALLKLNETIVGNVAVATIPDTKVTVKACRSAGKNGFRFLEKVVVVAIVSRKVAAILPMDKQRKTLANNPLNTAMSNIISSIIF